MSTVRPAFTIIELLIVVTVIAILVALLLPLIAVVREASRGVRCTGNMRSLSFAAIAYSDDNRGFFPPIKVNKNWDTSAWLGLHWFNLLSESYLSDRALAGTDAATATRVVRDCPTFRARAPKNLLLDSGDGAWWGTTPGVGYNGQLGVDFSADTNLNLGISSPNTWNDNFWWTGGGYDWGSQTKKLFRRSSVTYPSNRALFGDGMDWALGGNKDPATTAGARALPPNYGFGPIEDWMLSDAKWLAIKQAGFQWSNSDPTRHRGRMSIGFCDGRAALLPADVVIFSLENPSKLP